jgi:hypothetical protein
MKCKEVRSLLSSFLDNALPDAKRSSVSTHLSACDECQASHQKLEDTRALVLSLGRGKPPADLALQMRVALSKKKRSRKLVRKSDAAEHAQAKIASPIAASYLLELFLPKKQRESLIGDLEEEFESKILPKYGRRAAQIWFWKQAIGELGPGLYLRLFTTLIRRVIGG